MALTQDYIRQSVIKHTKDLISQSKYNSLRNYLIGRKWIDAVYDKIDLEVTAHYAGEEFNAIKELTQSACASQKISDREEYERDKQEKINDDARNLRLPLELKALSLEIDRLKIQHSQLENQFRTEQYAIQSLRSQISNLNQLHIHSCHESSMHGYVEVHSHNPDLQSLNNSIYLKEALLRNLSSQREAIAGEIANKEALCMNKKRELDVELPRKALNRSNQKTIRLSRERAKDTDIQSRLSIERFEQLNSDIRRARNTLGLEYIQLLQKAKELSYSVYCNELNTALCENTFKPENIDIAESDALKEIFKIESNINQVISYKKDIIDERERLEAVLKGTQNRLQIDNEFEAGYPRMKNGIENKIIAATNNIKLLEIKSKSYARTRTEALNTTYTGLAVGVVSGVGLGILFTGIISSLLISPLLFAIPAACLLVVMISSMVALVAHNQKNNTDSEISSTNYSISAESAALLQLDDHVKEAKQRIPLLEEKIKTTGSNIESHKQEEDALEKIKATFFTEASSVMPSSSAQLKTITRGLDFFQTAASAPPANTAEMDDPTNQLPSAARSTSRP